MEDKTKQNCAFQADVGTEPKLCWLSMTSNAQAFTTNIECKGLVLNEINFRFVSMFDSCIVHFFIDANFNYFKSKLSNGDMQHCNHHDSSNYVYNLPISIRLYQWPPVRLHAAYPSNCLRISQLKPTREPRLMVNTFQPLSIPQHSRCCAFVIAVIAL